MADSETPYQRVWQIEKRNNSRHAGLRCKRLAGMMIEWQLSSRHPSCSSTQPVDMFEQQRCLWQLHKASRHICCSCSDIATLLTEWHRTSRQVCYIDNVTVLSDKVSHCMLACLMEGHRSSSFFHWFSMDQEACLIVCYQFDPKAYWRLNSSHVLPPGHQTSLQSHICNYVALNPHTSLLRRLGASSHVCQLHRTSNTVRYNCTQLTGMLGTVAPDQQARLFKLHPASVHVCSICTRPAAQPSLPQGQQTYLPISMFYYVAQGEHICLKTSSVLRD